jgi:hypothetical protein
MRSVAWALAFVALLLLYYALSDSGIRRPPGVLVPDEPRQTLPTRGPWPSNGYRITPLAGFSMRGLVLHKERYWMDRGADLSPVDLALGWGPMSDQSIVDQLDLSQGGRFYRWSPKQRRPPIPIGEIASHSANMHMIPATPEVKRRLLQARQGTIVTLDGELVLVEGKDGFRWRSSLSRTDTGAGACELVWVDRVSVQP